MLLALLRGLKMSEVSSMQFAEWTNLIWVWHDFMCHWECPALRMSCSYWSSCVYHHESEQWCRGCSLVWTIKRYSVSCFESGFCKSQHWQLCLKQIEMCLESSDFWFHTAPLNALKVGEQWRRISLLDHVLEWLCPSIQHRPRLRSQTRLHVSSLCRFPFLLSQWLLVVQRCVLATAELRILSKDYSGRLEDNFAEMMWVHDRLSKPWPCVSVYGQGLEHSSKLIMFRRDATLQSSAVPCGGLQSFRTQCILSIFRGFRLASCIVWCSFCTRCTYL